MPRSTRSTKKCEAREIDVPLPKPRNAPLTFSLPRKDQVDPWFGLTRGYWNDLILPNVRNNFSPPVRSIVDRSRASDRRDGKAARCKRLVIFESALAHFNRVARENEEAKVA